MQMPLLPPPPVTFPSEVAPLADGVRHVVALSGGKDSTALALGLREAYPDADFTYVVTPTGDELPELLDHWSALEALLDRPLLRITAPLKDGRTATLNTLIEGMAMLPNARARWCTRMLKIQPIRAWIQANGPCVQYVGLRADEEGRVGLYGDDVVSRYPLREWGWGLREVLAYLDQRGVSIPLRTDCARCYGQRLGEWHRLWANHPTIYAEAEAQEATTGHTFRSDSRDTWPASLAGLRELFEAGNKPRGADVEDSSACRVCRL